MAKQNIYDNETFFEGYRKIRENERIRCAPVTPEATDGQGTKTERRSI